MLRAGRLTERIEIQRATTATDSFGEPIETWVTVATVWASVEPLTGNERFQAQQVQATLSHRIRLRPRDVRATDRVKWGDRILDINAVLEAAPDEKQLLCGEAA